MSEHRPTRLQRHVASHRASVRPTFAAVAVLGAVAGAVAIWAIDHGSGGDLSLVVSVALLVPALLFVLWWVFVPGVALDRDLAEPVSSPIDVDARIEKIEATFDALAVPRAARHIEQGTPEVQAMFRDSIRRSAASTTDEVAQFGIRRPAP